MTSIFIMVFDGLQPSQITPELMPRLAAFADTGVRFERHHPVFPTVTRINAASMVTGRYPGGHGLAANLMVMRELDPAEPFQVLEPGLRRLSERTGGRVLLSPPLAELLAQHGKQYVAVGVGTSGNAFVHNAHPDRSNGATIHPEFCLPDDLHPEILGRFGDWPGEEYPNAARLRHAGRIVTDYVIPERQPDVTLLWSSEPDKSQHRDGVNSELGKQSLSVADTEFGRILDWLEETGRRAETDVFVLSDHGYSTITDVIPVEAMVRDAGFPAAGEGGVVVAPNGGSVIFYTNPPSEDTADRLAAWLMTQPWCGSLLSSDSVGEIEGTLPLELAGGDGERAPDLAMSFAWNHDANEHGVPGHVFSSGGTPGAGQHGSMSPHEMRNTLIAAGPSFKSGLVSETPSGNVDLAPTILALLGLPGGEKMDGRVLIEALDGGPEPEELTVTSEHHSVHRAVSGGTYHQTVRTSRVGDTVYLDEGAARLE
ncbi:MAG: alkaline phosphatase family protein [Chloroflexi bacterium]|nr:alkaline phosphatase family protein [Chloroflexota bacterium]